jgi:hypothetical protein
VSTRLTDARRFYVLIRDAGAAGFHSHDARRQGVSGNPSQRAKDIVSKGVPLWTARKARNGRPGSLYWLDGAQPEHATPVRPNHSRRGRTCEICGGSIAHLREDARTCAGACRTEKYRRSHGQGASDAARRHVAVTGDRVATVLDYTGPRPRAYEEPIGSPA